MTTTDTNPLDQVKWDDVLDTLDAQRCVLFLGNGALPAPGGEAVETALCEWLDTGNADHPYIQVYNPDGFLLLHKQRYRRQVIDKMKRFYSQPFPEAELLYSRIARLPLSMIFSLTPDNILARTFDQLGLDYQPDFYFRQRKAGERFERPTRHKPLLYNLLGNIEEPESLVLSHGDFFDYLESMFKDNGIHDQLRDELESMERYIFLGLPYEKWYFQLLLRFLSLHSDKLKEVERLALKEFEDPRLHKIYTAEFKIEFFPASTEEFIAELFRRCEAENLLKPLPAVDPAEAELPDLTREQLRELIGKGDMEGALLHLKVLLQHRKPRSYALSNDLVVLRNRHRMLQQRELRDTIDTRDARVENAQIVEQVLALIDQAQNL